MAAVPNTVSAAIRVCSRALPNEFCGKFLRNRARLPRLHGLRVGGGGGGGGGGEFIRIHGGGLGGGLGGGVYSGVYSYSWIL